LKAGLVDAFGVGNSEWRGRADPEPSAHATFEHQRLKGFGIRHR
jgi:hypothetical protein